MKTDMGGLEATLPVAESAHGIIDVVDNLSIDRSGGFFLLGRGPNPLVVPASRTGAGQLPGSTEWCEAEVFRLLQRQEIEKRQRDSMIWAGRAGGVRLNSLNSWLKFLLLTPGAAQNTCIRFLADYLPAINSSWSPSSYGLKLLDPVFQLAV